MYLFIPYRTFYPFLSHFDIYTWRTSCVNNRSDIMNESDPRSDVHYLGSSENKA